MEGLLTEILRTRQGKVVEAAVQDVCVVLLSILEKSLYLGVCVRRTCGLNPHPLRADDFGKEYRVLMSGNNAPIVGVDFCLVLWMSSTG